jgi:hypothetical protein
MGKKVQHGRYTAAVDDEGVVVFLIGMRVNQLWRVDCWLWMFVAMVQMLRYLATHPDSGMIRARNWIGRTTMQVGYWRSVADLVAFAADQELRHAPAWRRFNQMARTSDAVGVWHETYVVKPGMYETVYANMPAFGLAEATTSAPVDASTSSSKRRMAHHHQPAESADA